MFECIVSIALIYKIHIDYCLNLKTIVSYENPTTQGPLRKKATNYNRWSNRI